MIGDYKGKVKNRVITAILQAYHDTLDYDGMKSILREAELLNLKDIKDFNPDESISFFKFKKIITAQNCLLYECDNLLFEIGRKFSFYLFPFGKNFQEIIQEITDLIQTDWSVEIVDNSKDEVVVQVENCFFCSEIGVKCDLFNGFLVHSLQKTLPNTKKVRYMTSSDTLEAGHHNYLIKLKIENIN